MVFAVASGATVCSASLPVCGKYVPAVFQVQQRPQIAVATQYYVSATASVATIGATFRHILCPVEVQRTSTTLARATKDFHIVDKIRPSCHISCYNLCAKIVQGERKAKNSLLIFCSAEPLPILFKVKQCERKANSLLIFCSAAFGGYVVAHWFYLKDVAKRGCVPINCNFAVNNKNYIFMKLYKLMAMGVAGIMASCSSPAAVSQDGGTVAAAVDTGKVVIENIMARRSVRQYKDYPVGRDTVQLLLECGINAPNGMNRQPWAVRVVDNPEYINGVTEVFKKINPKMASDPGFKNMFRNAPTVIFVANDPTSSSSQIDCGLLGENIMLAAQAMGLGTCCLGSSAAFIQNVPEAAEYLEKLDLPDGYALLYCIAVGYPDESPAAKERDASKVKFID